MVTHPAQEHDPYDAVHHALASGEGMPDAPDGGGAAHQTPHPAGPPSAGEE